MAKKKSFNIIPEHEEIFKDVVFLVEATHTEHFLLWKTEFEEPSFDTGIETWEDEGLGRLVTIGQIGKRPICVSIFYARINGQRVIFYEGTSQLVDHKMIEEWLQHWTLKTIRWDNGTRWAHSDAMNFHHCINAIEQIKGSKNEQRLQTESN